MSRYQITDEDRRKAVLMRGVRGEARRLRREAELFLLERLLTELAMPEMLPER